jgi:membrane-bound lytic murein transglycosylase MltF
MAKLILIIFFSLNLNANNLKDFILGEASKYDIDADLVLAIAYTESNLNPYVVGAHGEIGVFQLRPQYYKVSGDIKKDIILAIKHLVHLKNKYEPKHDDAWFVLFNYGEYFKFKDIKRTGYYNKVMSKVRMIKSQKKSENYVH